MSHPAVSHRLHDHPGRFRRRQAVAIALVLAILTGSIALASTSLTHDTVQTHDSVRPSHLVSYYPSTRSYKGVPYDEQYGITFTQDFSNLTFNVTATGQSGPDGNGPGYLLSGLTDAGYWYQTGLSYKWPDNNGGHLPGFAMNYEVFNYFTGQSIYPYDGGGGIENFTVNFGDLVLLSLDFDTSGNITMSAHDWNTNSSATQSFYGYGGSYFVGTPSGTSQNGFFTGLMTEQYYSNPSRLTGQPVTYSDTDFNYSTATLWIDEWNTLTGQNVFATQTGSTVSLNSTANNPWPAYLASNGTAEAANVHEFETGLQPLYIPSAILSSPAGTHPGDTSTLNLTLQNLDQSNGRVTGISLITDFKTNSITSAIDVGPGTSSHSVMIAIPGNLGTGNHTVTVHGTWQVYDGQLNAWVSPGSFQTSAVLSITATQQPVGLTALIGSLIPEIIAIGVAAGILLLLLTVNRRRIARANSQVSVPQLNTTCPRCGQAVLGDMMFCPKCGSSLAVSTSQPNPQASNEPTATMSSGPIAPRNERDESS